MAVDWEPSPHTCPASFGTRQLLTGHASWHHHPTPMKSSYFISQYASEELQAELQQQPCIMLPVGKCNHAVCHAVWPATA
jgi:hypothetical protein